jgi:hypothetical protein
VELAVFFAVAIGFGVKDFIEIYRSSSKRDLAPFLALTAAACALGVFVMLRRGDVSFVRLIEGVGEAVWRGAVRAAQIFRGGSRA